MNKTTKGLFVVLIGSVMLFSVLSTTAFGISADETSVKGADNSNVVTAKAASNQITWNGNGGKFGIKKTKTTTLKKGAKIKLPTPPKRTDYVLKGWYTKKSGGIKISKNTIPKKKVIYYAQWLKKYTLTFDPNGGKVTTKSKKVARTKAFGTLPKPTKSGYIFTGWYTKKSGGTKVATTTKMSTKNMIVYAHWKKGTSTTNRTLTASEKALVGDWWMVSSSASMMYSFANDGTFTQLIIMEGSLKLETYGKGAWSESGGTIYMSNRVGQSRINGGSWSAWKPYAEPLGTMKYRFGTDEKGKYFEELAYGTKYYKN